MNLLVFTESCTIKTNHDEKKLKKQTKKQHIIPINLRFKGLFHQESLEF